MPGRAFYHNAKKNKRHEKAGPAAEDLSGLSTAIYVAEEVGKVWEEVRYCSERCRRQKKVVAEI